MPDSPPLYFDHNANSPLRPELRATYLELLESGLGNPSSLHAAGRRARLLIDEARERIAAALAVHEDELVFTSGGTEADNLALLGSVRTHDAPLVTSRLEHAAVLEPAAALADLGHPTAWIEHDATGRVAPEALRRACDPHPGGVVAVAAANGEVGTVQPLETLVEAARAAGAAWFHTDAVQALGRVPLALHASGVDSAALSAHKLGGPVGVGVLYTRLGFRVPPLLHGGGQEGGIRPGTENAAAIAVAGLAIERAVAERQAFAAQGLDLTRRMATMLRESIPQVSFNGPSPESDDRLPNTLNVTLPGVDGRVLVTRLDLADPALTCRPAKSSRVTRTRPS
ncbi:MAG: aminotransferase class V-fold PLP-dependent enzyme, partial [Planctomycetota bacterium]